MTYDTWKTTDPADKTNTGFYICDGCGLTFPERDMTWHGTTCLCPRCAEKAGWTEPDDGC